MVLGVAAFFWYLWAVVHAYHREVREQQGQWKSANSTMVTSASSV